MGGATPYCFAALCGGRDWRGDSAAAWLLEVFLAVTLFPVTSPMYANGTLPDVALVLNPRVCGFVTF